VIAYKLLRADGTGVFSARRWPPPGTWLEAGSAVACRTGVHACRPRQLPLWLGLGTLWEVELDGDVVEDERKLIAERGRLVRPVDQWNDAAARAFRNACADAVRRRAEHNPELAGFAADAATTPVTSIAAFISARAAELDDGPEGYDIERARQAAWLTETLELTT